jgi:glyoxylase-like metal-dependent hydrolase (beta-lactamase superfamily II)
MIVSCIKNKPIDSNSYVIYQNGNVGCIVVDPGTEECLDLFQFLESHGLIPEYIILTHEHFDHLWGVNKLKDLFSSKTICSASCAEKIVDRKKNMSVFYNQVGFQSYPADILIENINCNFIWNTIRFEFVITEGHTDGSICIISEDKLFTGDTIIKNHKTVVKFPGGNKEKLQNSLKLIFSKFEGQKIHVYPGHGDCFYLDEIDIEEIM